MREILSLSNITKSYSLGDRSLPILKGIDLTIRKGEFAAIMGASGSGKSTLLHIMGGLDRPTSGSIFVDEKDLSTLDDPGLARLRNKTIGFVFQNFFLLNYYTALENVYLPLVYADEAKDGRERAQNLLEDLGLGERLHHKPNELSGGERQRVAIARALINNPALIFADEPTGSLDTNTGDAIMGLLEDIHRLGTTIVLITHDPHVAQRAERVMHMSDGVFI